VLSLFMSDEFMGRIEHGRRWDKHPSTVVRIMKRFGVAGLKMGDSSQSSRLYSVKDVFRVEKLANLKAQTERPS